MGQKLIFIVDDEDNIRRLLEFWIGTKWGYALRLFSDGEACLREIDAEPDLVVLDIQLPGIDGIATLRELRRLRPALPVVMLSAQGNMDVAVEAIKIGAIDYMQKTIDLTKLEICIRNALAMHDLQRENKQLKDAVATTGRLDNIISSAGSMEKVLALVHKAKDSNISVLINGESGTGKELIARAIHFNGKRKDGPFVAVNCAAIPKDLLESEMFGHEKGAFTGATERKTGRFEQADSGTIFLDEIGELDMNVQAKFLRAIQEREFQRVGGSEILKADVRIVSATNRDLVRASRANEFREDLYYRLASFPILLPPLRDRRADILLLAEHFLNIFSLREGKRVRSFSRRAIKWLYDYPWPGNVRELESAIERGILLCDGDIITEDDLPLAVRAFAEGGDVEMDHGSIFENHNSVVPLEEVKAQAVRHALTVCSGSITDAATRLGIGRSTIYELMKRYGIN